MADITSITSLDGNTYNIKDKIARASIKFGKVNSTSTSTAFTATIEGITELYDGVAVYLTNGVVTSAAGCTLNINGLGAKPMYYTTAAAARVTTHFNIAYTWLFVYNSTRVSGGCWDAYWGYDSNSDAVGYNLRDGSSGYKVKNILYRYQILFTYNNEYLLPSNTVQTSQTGPYSYTTEEFDPFGKICTYTTTTQVAADEIPSSSYLYYAYATVDVRWSFNVGTTLTPQKAVYIVAIPQENGKAVLADPPITQTLPTEEDGLLYIFLGQAYSTYQMAMSAEKPIYWHDGNGIRLWTGTEPQAIIVDSALSSTSTNPVQNKVINTAISAKYTKPSGGIPASDLASGVIPTVPSAYSSDPAMNGTASPGSGTAYALGNHVHPTDTTRQATLVSGTNIKTVNGNSLLGSGDLTVSGLPSVTTTDNGKVLKVVNGEWEASTGGSGLTDPGTLPSLTTTVSSETLTITWSAGTLPS